MDAPTMQDNVSFYSHATESPGGGELDSPIHRWAADRALNYAIGGDLASIQIQLDELIAARRDQPDFKRGDESERSGDTPSVQPVGIPLLERVREWLDRLVARFHASTSITEICYTSASGDLETVESRRSLENALAETARTILSRLIDPRSRESVVVDLQTELSRFERILDERDQELSPTERRSLAIREEIPRADESAVAATVATSQVIAPSRYEELSTAFHRHINDLRQMEWTLLRIDEYIDQASEDPSLQAFWRGVARDFQEEAHRLAWWIGEESLRLVRPSASGEGSGHFVVPPAQVDRRSSGADPSIGRG